MLVRSSKDHGWFFLRNRATDGESFIIVKLQNVCFCFKSEGTTEKDEKTAVKGKVRFSYPICSF